MIAVVCLREWTEKSFGSPARPATSWKRNFSLSVDMGG
jgi:hypothetical protein